MLIVIVTVSHNVRKNINLAWVDMTDGILQIFTSNNGIMTC